MLKELKFVQGAVAKKDLVPAMTHFKISEGSVRAYNGAMALCSPIPLDLDCIPKAAPLVKAISMCQETVSLSMTPAGRLRIQSGSFRAFIECVEGETPHVEPAGERVEFDGETFVTAIKTLLPFVGDDASRIWTNGILLKGESAFATNNVCLVEYWLGTKVPFNVNIPREALKEMLRIDEPPAYASVAENSISFHYNDDKWMRTQLLDTTWPDISKILDHEFNASPIDDELFTALEMLLSFSDDITRVYFDNGVLRTHQSDEQGAAYEFPGITSEGAYQIKMLNLLKGIATHVDFDRYPEPAFFFGDRLRGALIGMRA